MILSEKVIIRQGVETQHSRAVFETFSPGLNTVKRFLRIKRAMDILGALVGIILLAAIYPFIALGIKLSSRGCVIFTQKRTGFNGEEFICYKFRTMARYSPVGANDNLLNVTCDGDERVFKFGRFLRKNNLDELPQVINILKGEMSLVGPRPLMTVEHEYWSEHIPEFNRRTLMKPGLTGWAQVTGYRGGTLEEDLMVRRLKKDLKYLEYFSPVLDAKIILKTLLQMLNFNTKAY